MHWLKFAAGFLFALLAAACKPAADSNAESATAIPVRVVSAGDGYALLRGGEPYEVNGAGIEYGNIAAFAAHGGTSFRTWRTDNPRASGRMVLDEAEKHGLTVLLCIEIGRERHGFDYDDEVMVAAQLEYARAEVLKYRDHPALLAWMIGNEPNLFFKNPKVFDAINDISRMIHKLDPHHPVTTALAGFSGELATHIEERAPDLDFVSIQMYGDIINLPKLIADIGYDKPFMVTEWGAIGHWEVAKTAWGAPIEQNSSDKADNYLQSYELAIAPNPDQILGSYVFLWGQKQERTPTWYGMFLADGAETETIDAMHYLWTGAWPENRAPRVGGMQLDGQSAEDSVALARGKAYAASIDVSDPDDDALRFRWEVMRESATTEEGGDREQVPEIVPGLIDTDDGPVISMRAPSRPGPYRLFFYTYDGQGNAAHANLPFLVK